MQITKSASAHWSGDLEEGKGTISTESGALNKQPYGFNTRFEGEKGSNPEELIGAAHASCFTMALSKMLGESGFIPESLDTTAQVTLEKFEDGFTITAVHLTLKGKVTGSNEATFMELAHRAKTHCPVSKLLNAKITMDAKFL